MQLEDLFESVGISVASTEEAVRDMPGLQPVNDSVGLPKPLLYIPKGSIEEAVRSYLVPEAYADCEFDLNKIKENQRAQQKESKRRFKVKRWQDYVNITTGIISIIVAGKLPKQSYIIGAPNGFGKTSFVNSCIIKLHAQGRLCAPYVSLSELASIRRQHLSSVIGVVAKGLYGERYLRATLEEYKGIAYEKFDEKTYSKQPIEIIDRYSWSEYLNCDVLFCYFTDVASKIIESEMLKTVLTMRGVKGKPTIAMISSSLDPYKNDDDLREMVWDEILAYKNDEDSCDRVKHISCFKDYDVPLKSNM